MITSINNQQIKNIIKLQNKPKARNEQGQYIIEGIKLFEEAKKYYKHGIIKAYISNVLYDEMYGDDADNLTGIPYEIVDNHVFAEAAGTVTPQGILAVMKQPFHNLDAITEGEKFNLLLLENLRDPGNLGTIIRTAEGAGFAGIILSKGCADILSPKVIRSTMGSIFRVPFVYADNFIDVLCRLKNMNVKIFAAHLDGSIDYREAEYAGRNAIIIGNEANGISSEAAGISDIRLRIPMKGNVESLNAAVAAALLMYEASK